MKIIAKKGLIFFVFVIAFICLFDGAAIYKSEKNSLPPYEISEENDSLSDLDSRSKDSSLEFKLTSMNVSEPYIIEMTDSGYTAKCGGATVSDSSLSILVESLEADGAIFEFCDVYTEQTLEFEKNVTLGGTLSMKSSNINLRGNTVLDDFTFFGERASIRVKEGVTHGVSGKLTTVGCAAVVLDYHSSARFLADGIDIFASSSDGAIVCVVGSVEIYSANISNAYGAAIVNESSLSILGNADIEGLNFDVVTDKPISLSYGEYKSSCDISVMYGKTFEKGSFNVIFRGADESMLRSLILYDALGEEIEIEYFETSKYTDEKNVIAVYLPYSLKLYCDGLLYATEYFLGGEIPSAPKNVEKEGYTFGGWYKDTSFSELYSFVNPEYSDFSLYAAFRLTAPEFSISSLEFLYDGQKRLLAFDYLYHPLSDKGQFSFVWYKNSEPILSSGPNIQITNVSDSGSYYCKLTFSYYGDFVTITTPEVRVTVDKKIVYKPKIDPVLYTGYAISPNLSESLFYISEPFAQVNVGVYFVELCLSDFENCKWSDSDSEKTSVEFEIKKAENCFTEQPSVENIYQNEAPRVKYTLKFGEGIVEFSDDLESWNESLPKTAGSYYLRVRAEETENYSGVISQTVEFIVYEEICIGIKIEKNPIKTVYRAFELLELSGAEFVATYNSGRSEKVDTELLKVEYKNGSCFVVTDSSATVVFKGNSVPLPVSVIPCEYDISNVVFEDTEIVFDGLRHTIEVICDVVGNDGITLDYKITGGGINVGEYDVTLCFSTDSINYELPTPITKTLRIVPFSVTAVYSETEFVYDGTPKLPAVEIIGAQGVPVPYAVSGAVTDAGTYTMNVSVSDKNYLLLNPSVEFTVLKADFDISGIKWSDDSFVYDGNVHSVILSGLPSGIVIVGYANSSFTDAGSYVAEVTVSYDEKNYNAPPRLTHEWKIGRADYDMSGLVFFDSEFVFDGSCHFPASTGSAPIGIDGSRLSYSFSDGATHVSEGKKAVTVTFESESKNYNTPEKIVVYVTILPKPIEIEWGTLTFVYDGFEQVPSAKHDECKVNVTGSGINAGDYTATAEADSTDYEIINDEVVFTINKAENAWTSSLSAQDIYDGDEPNAFAEALSGEVKYIYYRDSDLSDVAQLPLEVGIYYVVAQADETDNYFGIISEAISFSVIEIVPVELKIEFNEPLVAMKKLSDFSFKAYFINNNGTETTLSSENLTVEYENGEELRACDTVLRVFCGELSVEIGITVEKYRVGIPIIEPVIYNGEVQLPSALSSPLFITDFLGAENAGEYKITPALVDTENYVFATESTDITFIILKAPITLEVMKNGSDYKLVEGVIFEGDELLEEYYEEDGKIYLRINNPNYELTVIPREEKNAGIYVLIIFLLALVIVLTAIGLYITFTKIEKSKVSASEIAPQKDKGQKNFKKAEAVGKKSVTAEEPPLETLLAVDEGHANDLISDSVAKSLITDEEITVKTDGKRRCILNLDTISENFASGETVCINDFKKKGLIPADAKYVKILARGVIDKPIHIRANAFSLSAVKMIALTGGSAKRVRTVRVKK